MIHTTALGLPRIGRRRELKRALESHWRGGDADALLEAARALRAAHWKGAIAAGAASVPVNDFSLYDQVLDTAVLFGAVPERHRALVDADPLAGYFAMARGSEGVAALEMTKWFDTNYHYLVPELGRDQSFRLSGDKPLAEWREAQALGFKARPVLLGPVSFLKLSKSTDGSAPIALLERLLPAYIELLDRLAQAGVEWVQLDEPCLVTDLGDVDRHAYQTAYAALAIEPAPRRLLATYFGGLGDNLGLAMGLPVDAIHVDLAEAPGELDAVLDALPENRVLSAGLIDGRNIWRSRPSVVAPLLARIVERIGAERVILAPSCSLIHVPYDVDEETRLAEPLRDWLAFAWQKLGEQRDYAAAQAGDAAARAALDRQEERLAARADAQGVRRSDVRRRLDALSPQAGKRRSAHAQRRQTQARAHPLPPLPTTTIGSFPQTDALRQARADHRAGRIDDAAYEAILAEDIARVIAEQERLGLDVLVHGEAERNDMVEYFGEQLEGFAFTRFGWVQSYGSRCVKPPIIWGDVTRPVPMTVRWARYAQSLTKKPVKGMLTGPVTMLKWSFVRDDLARDVVCRQIALALRDEVRDLEAAGIGIIQIDEPALREALPLRREAQRDYLDWAVESFRIASGGVADATQIHTHMCYSEFNEIIDAVAAMDADVISIETSRSHMELLDAFVRFRYPNGIGPGVYDIHSPRIPAVEEMQALLTKALEVLRPEQLWVNPDCGLKTRRWEEVLPALAAMVETTRGLRERLAA